MKNAMMANKKPMVANTALYRAKLSISESDLKKSIMLSITFILSKAKRAMGLFQKPRPKD